MGNRGRDGDRGRTGEPCVAGGSFGINRGGGMGGRGRGMGGRGHVTASGGGDRDLSKSMQREVVSGVRRIWETVKSSSHLCVKSTIVGLAGVGNIESIHVKRKYKTTSSGKPKWWYVIHADEDSVLKPLEAKWDSVRLQTGWLLEYCTKPADVPTMDSTSHINHNNDDTREVFDVTITPSSNNAMIVSGALSPSEANANSEKTSPSPESVSFLGASSHNPHTHV